MPDINGIPYVESTDLVSAYPAASQALAQEISDQLASKLPYSFGTATPSTTDSGFLWYDSNSTPPVPKYWNGSAFANFVADSGLILVASEPVSTASSVSIDNCFTSDYDNYKIFCRADSFASSDRLDIRLRGSGSDVTSNYAGREINITTTNAIAASAGNTGQFRCILDSGTGVQTIFGEIQSPARATMTVAHLTGQKENTYRSGLYTNTNATAYDGLTVYSENGNTWSGHVYVYAYQETI